VIEPFLIALALAFVVYAFCAAFSAPAYWRWNGLSYRDHDFEPAPYYNPYCRRCGGEPEQHPPLYERIKRRTQ
jgi:hypothetical protein